jgi:endonuclease/exonuclease/phosphatase (EEP) superfamily protein YafD
MTNFLVVWPFCAVALAPGALMAMPFLLWVFILLLLRLHQLSTSTLAATASAALTNEDSCCC